MFVVINIDPGSTLNELMAFMTQRTITFSVTDQLSRLCEKAPPVDRREIGVQTDEQHHSDTPPSKKQRLHVSNPNHYNTEDCGSPCSSATPSEPNEPQIGATNLVGILTKKMTPNDAGTDQCELKEADVLRNLIMEKLPKREDPEEESVEDEMSNDMANQISSQFFQAFFAEKQNGAFGTIEENDSLEGDSALGSELPTSFPLDGSPVSAIRYKPAYASTKRGVCHVCNREVSLITTHRRRHAITHLGFKTLKCGLCHKFFSRQDLATGHFKKDHPNDEFFPFVDTMSDADEQQLITMLGMCFPEENLVRKRNKDGEPPKKIAKD